MKLRNFTLFYLLFFASFAPLAAQVCYYEPADASIYDEMTFYFDATQGNGGLASYTGDVYAHVGVITNDSQSNSDWKHASTWLDNDEKYKLTRSEDNENLYYFTIIPYSFFGISSTEVVNYFAFVFRSADGVYEGKDTGSADILVELQNKEVKEVVAGAYISHSFQDGVLLLKHEIKDIYITPYNAYTAKIMTVPADDTPNERTSITVSATPEASATVEDTGNAIVLSCGSINISVSKENGRISFYDLNDKLLLQENMGVENGSSSKSCTFKAAGEAAFYGGGYNGSTANINNKTLVMTNTQNYGWAGSTYPNNICIPFIVSTAGYGILFDDHYMGASITPSSTAGTSYYSSSSNDIAYYFVGGDGTMASVLDNYTFLTGKQELPPYWALGYISSRYGYKTQSEAEQVVETFKNNSFPIDAIVFDLYWQGASESGMGNLDWYTANFPDAEQMMADFKEQNIQTICITEPFFTSACSNFQTLSALGYFADENVPNMEWLSSSQVGLIDASNPDAMAWMWEFYKQRTTEGISGWWLDLGEPEQHSSASVHQGGTMAQVHNEFGNLWVESVYNGLKTDFPDTRPFIMPRAGTSGMQRFSVFPWTGDIMRSWSGLQSQVPALLNSGMSGVAYMGSDVGGFASYYGTNPDLYLRWVEFAVFSPAMRTHSSSYPEPYNDCYNDVFESVKSFVNLRYKYLPYTYTLCYENASSGTPLARPLTFYDSDNSSLSSNNDSYLWGKDIFVAPVLEDATSRSITFPEGTWIDMNDYSITYTGGSTTTYNATLETLPYFARKGSFITTFAQSSFSNTADIDNDSWHVLYFMPASGEEAVSYVYDDNKTLPTALEDEQYSLISFSGSTINNNPEITIEETAAGYSEMSATRSILFEIPNLENSFDYIQRQNSEGTDKMQAYTDEASFNAATDNAYYLNSDNTLYIKTVFDNYSSQTITIVANASSVDETTAVIKEFKAFRNPNNSETRFMYKLSEDVAEVSIDIYGINSGILESLTDLPTGSDRTQIVFSGKYDYPQAVYIANLKIVNKDGTVESMRCKFML